MIWQGKKNLLDWTSKKAAVLAWYIDCKISSLYKTE